MSNEAHLENKEVVKRLKRAHGHLKKVIEMIEENERCIDVAQQLQAVSSAVCSAKKTYLQDHVEHCFTNVDRSSDFDQRVKEFKVLAKYF